MKIVPLRTIDTSSMSTVEYVSAKEVAFEVQTLIERGATTILIDDDRGGNGHFVIHSPRHGFKFNRVPTVRGSMYGGSIVRHYPDSYALILDCVFEMADDISNGNGVSAAEAIEIVCRDEDWRLLPTHKREIIRRLEAP